MSKKRTWKVEGRHITYKTMWVEADSAEEALEKAKRGEYYMSDTEPGPDINQRNWTAAEATT